MNIAAIALDRISRDAARANRTALRWIDSEQHAHGYRYRALAEQANRFAHLLDARGVPPRAVVASFIGRLPALYTAALDLKADDIYWCTADPGWVAGTAHGILKRERVGGTPNRPPSACSCKPVASHLREQRFQRCVFSAASASH
jgi:acyl-coenzyme A synthetase/AMP-(fatty) acid ligase